MFKKELGIEESGIFSEIPANTDSEPLFLALFTCGYILGAITFEPSIVAVAHDCTLREMST